MKLKFENATVRDQYVELYQRLNPRGPFAEQFEVAVVVASGADGTHGCFSTVDMMALKAGVNATQRYVDANRFTLDAFYRALKHQVRAAILPAQKLYQLQNSELCHAKQDCVRYPTDKSVG
ncbi:MAG: hypothetical protein R3C68_14715 [Myxococcota bacterium]